MGRTFVANEGQPGANPVVFSHELWRTRFNAAVQVMSESVAQPRFNAWLLSVFAAGYVPARRITRVEQVISLRTE